MTTQQRISLRLSEVRTRLNEIAGLDDLTDEVRAEGAKLREEYETLETRSQFAILAGETVTEAREDGEGAEVRSLRRRARVGDFVAAALTGRAVRGASGEYSHALGLDGRLPLDLLEPERRPETRAVTPGPSNETITSTRPTVPYAFERTDAAALGVRMPTVSPGEAHFPALTTAPPAAPQAEDAAADATAAAYTLTKRTPTRITGQFVIRLEDIALFPAMETDLRRSISRALADRLDKEIIIGDGSSPNLSGLFNQATDVTAAASVETFATGVARIAALVDGRHANGWGDIRLLLGVDTFELYAGLFQSNGDVSLFDYLAGKVGMVRVSNKGPAKASNAQKGLALLGAQGQSVQVPVWSGVELISDPYTQAAKGQRIVTAVMLCGSPFVPYGTSQVVEVHPKLST